MGKYLGIVMIVMTSLLLFVMSPVSAEEASTVQAKDHAFKVVERSPLGLPEQLNRFVYDSGYHFTYPEDGVRGIYVTGNSAGGERFESLLELVNSTDLNSMVIDIKEDHGHLTYRPEEDSPFYGISQNFISNTEQMMETLEENEIYPIARIVVFKDSILAEERPDLSFLDNGQVWKNGRGEAFVNPFLKEVWDYNIDIAEEAAKMGFKEIQFDYVRFPEGFERRDEMLQYSVGEYEGGDGDNIQKRVSAVTDFVAYARERLAPYDVDVSVDIFGYAATISEAPGIGQNFSKISENVDVISSMIYPSHWTPYFGLDKPDLYPYELTKEYAKVENQVLGALEESPVSRPWIQDFTASYLGSGNYLVYGKEEVEAQIRALNEEGIDEFLLWNASNRYTEGVNYKPLD
ncbi:GTP-binding protein [Alkalihalophilus pseudofirmus]|uniref:Glycoside hydrolase n=1 Tax=Alkalihalophilus pseudofirmus TaxID=79885 RepID=A0AAJ2NNP7_ALKPS|nr:putative glycoside hydrolase [Alkalihalophilus pseudofirmus]MDV2885633.1 putative glycoside hydrolase [Alkalihalophilus pseudofirmus]OLS39485.1 GTP-binding protein [Alkalihalophilus pseudofirmus]